MANLVNLLPPTASDLEKDLVRSFDRDLFTGLNFFSDDDAIPIKNLYNPDKLSAQLLPYIAYVLSVDFWDDTWSDSQKREVIRDAYKVQSKKGTLQSVRDACQSLGFTVSMITENVGGNWAVYDIEIAQPISNSVAAVLRNLIEVTAPLRNELMTISYTAAQHNYDGSIQYDGSFNYGTI